MMKKQFSAIASARLLSAITQTVSLLILVRLITISEFGLFSSTLAAFSVIYAIASFGLVAFVLREQAADNSNAVHFAVRLNSYTTAITASISLILLLWVAPTTSFFWSFLLISLSIAVEKNTEVRVAISIANKELALPALSIGIRAVLSLAIFMLGVAIGISPLLAYGLGRAAASTTSQFITMLKVRVPLGDAVALCDQLRQIWPLAVSNSVGALRALDTTLVTIVSGLHVGGLYGAASRTVAPASIVANSLSTVLMPHAVRSSSNYLRLLIQRVVACALVSTVLVTPIALYLGGEMVALLFGSDYHEAKGAFIFLIISLPATIISPMIATILQGRGADKEVAINSVTFTIITLVTIPLCAHYFGSTGAGAGFAISTWLRLVSIWFISTRRFQK